MVLVVLELVNETSVAKSAVMRVGDHAGVRSRAAAVERPSVTEYRECLLTEAGGPVPTCSSDTAPWPQWRIRG